MTQWEYNTVSTQGIMLLDELDDLGKEGWELVAINNDIAYFKRPIEPVKVNKIKSGLVE